MTERVRLDSAAVRREAWRLYKRLLTRSVPMGAVVFGVVHLVDGLLPSGSAPAVLSLVLTFAGVSVLQGGLVEIVRGLHADGDADASVAEALQRASGRGTKLVAVSLLSAIGTALGFLVLIVPGLVLATRWAVAVPVAMLEDGSARGALRRSRELIAGNGWAVFRVLVGVAVVNGVVGVVFAVATAGSGPFGIWVGATVGSALGAPYAAHALTVVYYALRDPGTPTALEPGTRRWESVSRAED